MGSDNPKKPSVYQSICADHSGAGYYIAFILYGFALALGGATRMIGNIPYLDFLAPGLIMMFNGAKRLCQYIVLSRDIQGSG